MTYTYFGVIYNVIVEYKANNKHMYIRFKNDTIYVSTYRRLTSIEVEHILDENAPKLIKRVSKRTNTNTNNTKGIYIEGVFYNVEVISSAIEDCLISGNTFYVYTKKIDKEYITKLIKSYCLKEVKRRVERIFDLIVLEFSDVVKKPISLNYSYSKTFFGKCYRLRNQITFSGICAHISDYYLEYIIYHELSHMKYGGHQENFYTYLCMKMPDAKIRQKELKRLRYKNLYIDE